MKPAEIDNVTFAFPASVGHLIPKNHPEFNAYRAKFIGGDSWGFKLFNDWFYMGLSNLKLSPKEGVDSDKAVRHIQTIMRSFEPKHEDKTAACALLFELWFERAEWKPKSSKSE